jgi:myo-inositol-1(or 4)-monophosphatase
MDDVTFGYVYDFGTGEEWTARRGEGAWLDGVALGAVKPKDEIELLAFEATLTSSIAEKASNVVGLAHRLRVMGSLALALCNLAAGRIDGVCSLKGARSVDIAAASCVREVGLAIDLFESPPFGEAPSASAALARRRGGRRRSAPAWPRRCRRVRAMETRPRSSTGSRRRRCSPTSRGRLEASRTSSTRRRSRKGSACSVRGSPGAAST